MKKILESCHVWLIGRAHSTARRAHHISNAAVEFKPCGTNSTFTYNMCEWGASWWLLALIHLQRLYKCKLWHVTDKHSSRSFVCTKEMIQCFFFHYKTTSIHIHMHIHTIGSWMQRCQHVVCECSVDSVSLWHHCGVQKSRLLWFSLKFICIVGSWIQFSAVQCGSFQCSYSNDLAWLSLLSIGVFQSAVDRRCEFSSSEDILPASIFFFASSCAVSHDYKDYNKNGLRWLKWWVLKCIGGFFVFFF